jgi:hypothetical protein
MNWKNKAGLHKSHSGSRKQLNRLNNSQDPKEDDSNQFRKKWPALMSELVLDDGKNLHVLPQEGIVQQPYSQP